MPKTPTRASEVPICQAAKPRAARMSARKTTTKPPARFTNTPTVSILIGPGTSFHSRQRGPADSAATRQSAGRACDGDLRQRLAPWPSWQALASSPVVITIAIRLR